MNHFFCRIWTVGGVISAAHTSEGEITNDAVLIENSISIDLIVAGPFMNASDLLLISSIQSGKIYLSGLSIIKQSPLID